MQQTLQRIGQFVPDLSGIVPEPLKPYAKFVVVVVIGLIYLLVTLTVLDDSTGREWAGGVLVLASALGVIGTENEGGEDIDDPPPDDALVSDGGDLVDPSGPVGFEPDDEAGEAVEQPPMEDESVKTPGEEARDPDAAPSEPLRPNDPVDPAAPPPPEPPAESGR